ncbi:hypothetical protein SVAN01_10357 [Stagonosporopsis vannaccii]|nr:hypothetical protein SVAN01_10357 [Stagonosporopsis vannaccii]
MDFRALTNYFDGTIFADDYRADLSAARERMAALEARTSADPKENDQIESLLVQAVYSSICGDYVRAQNLLKELCNIAQSSNNNSLLSRCTAYQIYVQCIQNNPPFLRFRVDSDTGPGVVRSVGVSALRTQLKITPKMSSLEKFETNLLRLCTDFHTDLWLKAFPEHPQYYKSFSFGLFEKDKDYWNEIRQAWGDTTFPAIISYCNSLTLQYRLAGDFSEGRSSLSSTYEDVLEKGDFIAAAHCQLQLGDAILSPPFTSPLALNLVSAVSAIGWSNDNWDKKQREFPIRRDAEAVQCYQEAYFLFEAGSSRRGTAAVLLRYACLDIAEAILEPIPKDTMLEQSLVLSAYNHLTIAKEFFEGDITSTLIVDGYLAVCMIMNEDLSTALEICFKIGELSRKNGNTCVCEFVGMLYLRLARILALDEARVQHATVLCFCAAVCFKGLENPFLELHAVAASAKLHRQQGDIPMSTTYIEKGRVLLGLTSTYFDILETQTESLRHSCGEAQQKSLNHDLQMLRSNRTTCINEFNSLAEAIETRASREGTQTTSSTSSTQVSQMTALLESVQLLSGIDPSIVAAMRSLTSISSSIDVLRRKYKNAIRGRRYELVHNANIDAAERHLIEFLQELEEFSSFSAELEVCRIMALQYLGEYERATHNIVRILPTDFGGTRRSIPMEGGWDEQMRGIVDRTERQGFDRALALCFVAKDWRRGMAGIATMLQQDAATLDDMKSSEDPFIWYNMVWTASILEQNGDLGGAFEWYINAFHTVETHRQQLADVEDRMDIYSTIHSSELFLGMARIAFHHSKSTDSICGPSERWRLTPPDWNNQMLRFLELGRSRTLLDLLLAQKLAPQEFREWSEYSFELRSKSTMQPTAEVQSQTCAESQNEGREQYLGRIHEELIKELKSPSLSKLLPETMAIQESNAKLYQCIPETAIVVHINIGREGLMILCITSEGIIDVYTAELTQIQLDRQILRFAKLFRDKNLQLSSLPDITTCNQHLQAISNELIEPVAQHIRTKDHVIFIPAPSLNKFPLNALIYDKKPLFLSKDVSQAPSLTVLQYLIDKQRHANKKISVVYKDPASSIDGALDFSTSAAIHIARSFHATPRPATDALTQTDFVEMYEQSDVLLIATHGTTGSQSAWESSLLLHPPFLVRDLVKMQSNASLVIFEACVSGLGEESIGNDLLGFSHAVLASGATAFLGGLWKLSDEASALLMLFLFEELRTEKGSKTLARCWRNAQTRLYGLDAAGAATVFEDLRKRCLRAYKAGLVDREVATRLRWTLEVSIKEILQLKVDYSHPFYWAPFVLMGHAGLVMELL